jgi:hypothetical protein
MSYSGNSIQLYNTKDIPDDNGRPIECTTPCGDCEHVSAIMASYIAGMLKSGGFAKFYWASYYVACVECNRRKSNYIGVKLHSTKGWEVDEDGVNAIVNAIFPEGGVEPHASEYNPIRNALTTRYNAMPDDEKNAFRAEVHENIKLGTQTWCITANEQMTKSNASSKMAFNVSRIIVAITGHLEVITKKLQKKASKSKTVYKSSTPGIKKGGPKRKNGGMPTSDDDDYDMPVDDYILRWGELNVVEHVDEMKDDEEGKAEMSDDEEGKHEVKDDDEGKAEMDTEDDNQENIALIKAFIDEFLHKEFGEELFDQYVSDPDIFEMLMTRLSHSMDEIIISLHDIKEVVVPAPEAGVKSAQLRPTVEVTPLKQKPTEAGVESAQLRPPAPPSKQSYGTVVGSESQESVYSQDSLSDADSDAKSVSQTPDDIVNPNAYASPVKATPKESAVVTLTKDKSATDDSVVQAAKMARRESSSSSEQMPAVILDDLDPDLGGGRSNKRHSKNNSQTHKQKNRTKRVSYIKHKQTRKNQHSRKTNKK